MKKIIIALLLQVISIPMAYAQESVNGPMDKIILEQAHKMGKYFIAKDYAAFAKYTHPTTLELMGGEEKMLEELRRNFAILEGDGVTFLSLTFTAPSQVIVAEEGELQSTLTQMIEMKVVGGTMTVYATVITISRDGGKNWYFLDTAGNDLTNMRKLIPNLSTELIIPEPLEPAFIPDPEK